MAETPNLTKKDFKSDQEVKWCPGCGDYAILSSVQAAFANLGIKPHEAVFISGIGCSSRFPYYMNTFGFHTIHGRAPAIATGVKVANPNLSVWVATGDGDSLSIGGNHFVHALRRNVDIKILVFNNQIYGLTKGQYSPTSPQGHVTKTSPMGAPDRPFNPVSLALGSNATFVARTVDTHPKHMTATIEAAARHKGAAVVEIFQNCVIFYDGAFGEIGNKKIRDDRTVDLRPGKPLVFGVNQDKGIKAEGFETKLVSAEEADIWDPTIASPGPAFTMSQLDSDPNMPTPIGIFRQIEATPYDRIVEQQIGQSVKHKGAGTLKDLIYAGDTWEVS